MNMEERPFQVIEEYLLVLYKLQRDRLIKVNRSKEIQLTQLGFEMAENIAYRHKLAEDFLCNTLGIPRFEVHKHAHQLNMQLLLWWWKTRRISW